MEIFENIGAALPLKDQVYNQLKLQIILGNLEPGTRLSMLELADSMNVSRAPVREALSMLSKDGLVTITPRKQAVVADVSKNSIKMIGEIRLMLESYAAKQSTWTIPSERLLEVETMLRKVLDTPTDVISYVKSDLAIHELLYNYTGCDLLRDILTMVKQHSLRIRYLPEDKALNKSEIVIQSTQEHLEIINSLKKRNETEVYNAIKHHLENSNTRALSTPE
ncbi:MULTISPECIES: GntR family transcriptional regulator [Sporomusa]|jgi:DNA-binding GntR family transcriptional regulator|uniref:HTH-type transcriptional repressor RspR n=1 Tax=Sporomusa silvacetica DSM 10669 TaxID=1123289 RepID=A0ABZ3IUI7_9FIRM|nr:MULTISPECIES: GntR family transcriptional regulator [Sporomusa]OZC19522.1 HTH-type transcriptional regulator McbR [Sporomusa silvacetica DSM 10669]TWH46199.1 DNA-binding GntR family transcriptional regulator [Sporomusa sp. KB1]